MAQEGQELQSLTLPAPPPFHRYFTPENLSRLEEHQKANQASTAENAAAMLLDLPPELRCLIPPKPPTDGKYNCFGFDWDTNEAERSLKDFGQEQLFPDSTLVQTNPAPWLLRLTRSILLKYVEYVGTLSVNAEQWIPQYEDLKVLFVNVHYLVSMYRPHQARETLIMMMEEEVHRRKAEIEGVKKARVQVDQVLSGLGKVDEAMEKDEETVNIEEQRRRKEQLAVWDCLAKEIG